MRNPPDTVMVDAVLVGNKVWRSFERTFNSLLDDSTGVSRNL